MRGLASTVAAAAGAGALLLLASLPPSLAIYPDDHWTYSTELTRSNFEETVQAEIDAGRTMFAPAWNDVTRAFAGNDDVSFGDVNLSEESIRGPPHNPGAGGWPTIRYFNSETGIEGASYEKKTDEPMCTELGGDGAMMEAYVEEAGNTSLCSVATGDGCSDKERAYIDKMKAKGPEDQAAQLRRLQGMEAGAMKPELKSWTMKPELKSWLNKRKKILGQLVKSHEEL